MSETRPPGDRDERSLAASAILVVAVGGVLLAGLFLRTEAPAEPARESSPPPSFSRVAAPPVPAPIPERSAVTRNVEPSAPPELAPAGTWGPPAAGAPAPAGAPKPSAVPAPAPPASPARAAPKPAEAKASALADRAQRDAARLAQKPGHFTAQILVGCQPETVERLLAKVGSSPSLYVLPATSGDRSCFRVVWGTYTTRKDAAHPTDLPPALRGEKPAAKSVEEALR